jgi:hypothetical protein
MKIKQLSAKPKLVPVIIDNEEIVKEFGETIEFYTWDRQPLDMFLKLAGTSSNDYGEMVKVLKTMILDEDGKEVIDGDFMLPTKVLVAAMTKLTDQLGN